MTTTLDDASNFRMNFVTSSSITPRSQSAVSTQRMTGWINLNDTIIIKNWAIIVHYENNTNISTQINTVTPTSTRKNNNAVNQTNLRQRKVRVQIHRSRYTRQKYGIVYLLLHIHLLQWGRSQELN